MRLIDADNVNWGTCPVSGYAMKEWLAEQPTIDAVPVVHGKWKSVGLAALECSKCGYVDDWKMYYNYCPNCGATIWNG